MREEYELFPYQVDGADWLASHFRAGLFDVPGLGKTAQAIRALDNLGVIRTLVICPASVRGVWPGEFHKFASIRRRILRAKTVKDLNVWLNGHVDVLILSYEQAANWGEFIIRDGDIIPCIIFDEAHYLKSPQAKRTKAALGKRCDGVSGFARFGSHVWFLTGTPMSNDPSDIWTWLRFCDGVDLSLGQFTTTYFQQDGIQSYTVKYKPRREMLTDLKRRIAEKAIRRTKEQVGLDLPPIFLTTQNVEGNTNEIRELLRDHPGLDEIILRAVERGGLTFLDAQHIGTLRRLVGTAKAPHYSAQLIEELQTDDAKRVVIGIHRAVLDTLAEALTKAGIKFVRIDGSVSGTDRENAVREFQRDPECRVFLGNIKAAGTGITLTSAYRLDMLEWSWAPADNAQALMRVHRIGQENDVHARFISLAGSIDERISRSVAQKTAAIAMIQEDGI